MKIYTTLPPKNTHNIQLTVLPRLCNLSPSPISFLTKFEQSKTGPCSPLKLSQEFSNQPKSSPKEQFSQNSQIGLEKTPPQEKITEKQEKSGWKSDLQLPEQDFHANSTTSSRFYSYSPNYFNKIKSKQPSNWSTTTTSMWITTYPCWATCTSLRLTTR